MTEDYNVRRHTKLTHPVPVKRGQRIWLTSDTHYGHANVIKYSNRPFESTDDMDTEMVYRWNHTVSSSDLVYHLGDFALCKPDRAVEIAKRLNGQKFYIFGNHDKALRKHLPFLSCWIWARDLHQIEVQGQKITLCHYAMRTWPSAHHGAWQLYGHSHGSMRTSDTSRQTDVGVDCWDYAPVSFETLRDLMSIKTFVAVDRHEE